MTVHGGRFGVINGASTVRNWSIVDTEALQPFKASNTKAGTGRRRGVKSWTGAFNAYGPAPAWMPGASFSFAGFTAPANDTSGVGVKYSGTALVDSISVLWDFMNAAILQCTVNFSGHLALTIASGQAQLLDASTPTAPEICGLKLQAAELDNDTGDLDDFADIAAVATATLNITAVNQPFVNSDTACWTGRKAGPIDWTMGIVLQTDDQPYAKGTDLALKLFTENAVDPDDSLFWLLQYAKVKEYTGLQVDLETGAIISQTMNLEMNGHPIGATDGVITLPGDVAYWPAA